MTPFIGFASKEPIIKLDSMEVEEVFSVNILDLINNDKLITHRQLNGRDVTIPYFNLNNQQVWGATSMVLSEFKDMLHLI